MSVHPIPLIWTSDIWSFGDFPQHIFCFYGLFSYMDHFSRDKRGPYIPNWMYFCKKTSHWIFSSLYALHTCPWRSSCCWAVRSLGRRWCPSRSASSGHPRTGRRAGSARAGTPRGSCLLVEKTNQKDSTCTPSGGQILGLIDFNFVVPPSAQFCLGICKVGKSGIAVWKGCGISKIKSTKFSLLPPWPPCIGSWNTKLNWSGNSWSVLLWIYGSRVEWDEVGNNNMLSR